ncbi:DMT family transporter [Candidatus Formimonas warabiya]|uniref:EamA domain-containing protein n=1 Tax=Formimonas warabiya TaxID=1761012 RepID=A0A3G1KVT2_FORW1|nr:EamA family transporter [Candidatus Formimonas warabiya]ATW26556.1 hypothetical protein DCMF_18970 [Candidatus Formimonas warabiya]
MHSARKGAFLVTAATCLFATEAIFAKLAYGAQVNLITVLALRFVLPALILLLVSYVTGTSLRIPPGSRKLFLPLFGIYVVIALLLFQSFALLPATMAIMFFYAFPVLTGLLAFLVDGERLAKVKICALVISACGLILLLWTSWEKLNMWGAVLALIAASANALYMIYLPKLLKTVHQVTVITWFFVGSTVFFGFLGLFSGALDFHFALSGWVYLAGLSLISTATATLALIYGLPLVGPTLAAIINTLEPPCTAFLAYWVFGEKLTGWQIIGALLVLSAVLLPQLPIKNEKYRETKI